MTTLNQIRNGWIRWLAPWGATVWLAVVLTPCVCAIAQAQTIHGHTLQAAGTPQQHFHGHDGGTSGAAADCCNGLVVQAAVDASQRIKLPEFLPSTFVVEPAVVPVALPSVPWSADSGRDRERAPPVYLATRRLRI